MLQRLKYRAQDTLTQFGKVAGILLLTNSMSFCSVAGQKHILHMTNEKAAIINAYGATPILYDPGYTLGHKTFYGDDAYLCTLKENTGFGPNFPKTLYLGYDKCVNDSRK